MLVDKINHYIEEHRFSALAVRYAENIANGRFLWRNRVGAEQVEVQVTESNGTKMIFNSDNFNLRAFSEPTGDIIKLAELIEQGLKGNTFVFFTIDAFARLGMARDISVSRISFKQ